MREVYSRDSSERWGRFLSVTPYRHPSREISLRPYLPGRSAIPFDVGVHLCTYTYNALVRALKSQKYAEFRRALIDVTITAIYPEARLFLCDTMQGPAREENGWGRRRQGGNCWMRPSKWVPSPVVGATMAKYKSKSQPPSFLLSFRPRTSATPSSSSFVYSLRASPTMLPR